MTATNQNGAPLRKNVRRDGDGTYSANVWFGFDGATTVRRYFGYATRSAARGANIAEVPAGGRVGKYESWTVSIG